MRLMYIFQYTLVIDKYDGDQYQENYYNEEGVMCDALDKYATKGWEKIINMAQPRPDGKCNARGVSFPTTFQHLPLL